MIKFSILPVVNELLGMTTFTKLSACFPSTVSELPPFAGYDVGNDFFTFSSMACFSASVIDCGIATCSHDKTHSAGFALACTYGMSLPWPLASRQSFGVNDFGTRSRMHPTVHILVVLTSRYVPASFNVEIFTVLPAAQSTVTVFAFPVFAGREVGTGRPDVRFAAASQRYSTVTNCHVARSAPDP